MKILVDENIPRITVEELRRLGHDVLDVRGTPQQGMEDDDLWRLAQTEQRLLITTDKGFAEHRDEEHIAAFLLFAFGSRMSNVFTPELWLALVNSKRTSGVDCWSSCEMLCRAWREHNDW